LPDEFLELRRLKEARFGKGGGDVIGAFTGLLGADQLADRFRRNEPDVLRFRILFFELPFSSIVCSWLPSVLSSSM
jgi:hypothetical protein